MAIDKLNSLQFLFFRSDYFQEFGDRDGVYVDRVPFELRQRLLRWTWPTTERDQYFFQHEGHDVITREGWEVFVRWVCCAMDRQLGAESVRLSGDPLGSLAGTDEIINRGDREAFAGLLHAIIEQPGGPIADRVRVLYERVQHRAADPEFAAWPQYQAAYWLTEAMGRPADATRQRFASVWDAIEDDTAEAEKMKRLSALRAVVPVHERDGRPLYVILDDIPQPWRDQFWAALRGSQCPKVKGVERAAYVWDWQSWMRDLEDKT